MSVDWSFVVCVGFWAALLLLADWFGGVPSL